MHFALENGKSLQGYLSIPSFIEKTQRPRQMQGVPRALLRSWTPSRKALDWSFLSLIFHLLLEHFLIRYWIPGMSWSCIKLKINKQVNKGKSIQSLSCVWFFVTPWTAAHQASQHQLLELAQTHAHWVTDVIQPSHPLSSPSPPAFNLSQNQGLFQWVSSSYQVAKVLELQLHQSFQRTLMTDLL